jgi:hypothetical protein
VNGGTVISHCDGIISNCLIADNTSSEDSLVIGAAIEYCQGLLKNCTIANNYSNNGIEVFWNGGHITIENCIIRGNLGYQIFVPDNATADIQYCNIEGGLSGIFEAANVKWGPGNIDVNPGFAGEGYWDFNEPWTLCEGDYHLKSQAGRWEPSTKMWVQDDVTSPCIDAGDPMSPIGLEPFPNGGIINMGAFGGTAEASKSYFGRPICEIIVAGDVNGDCIVNFLDFRIMALHWLQDNNPPSPPYPPPPPPPPPPT